MRTFLKVSLVLAALLMGVQTASLSHAAEHGDHEHEHHGIECELEVLAISENAILPETPSLGTPRGDLTGGRDRDLPDSVWRWPPERAPPPRGPPGCSH